jgi:acetylornithine/N-succinyldiaminopimelate aminotransferase
MPLSTEEIIALEKQYVLQTYRRPDFVLDRGEGVYLYDTKGNRYLDLIAGIAVNALGYSDGEVLEAIAQQSTKLIHVSNLYHTEPHARVAQLLVENSFADRVFFCNSGTESVEAALKFARKWSRSTYTGDKTEFVAFSGSFHGRTLGALSTTWKERYRTFCEPLIPGVHFATFNDLSSAEKTVDDETCAVIVEPIQGEGGVNLADEGFLAGLRELCDEREALLIFDEVQCGLGRTGYLWAHDFYGVRPDIMCLAKPLGGGLPIGATLMTQRIADSIEPGDHGSTFAANPVVCAVAEVILRRVSDPAFLASVQSRGAELRSGLSDLQRVYPSIEEIRGRGLMWGIEIEADVQPILQRGRELGMLMGNAGERVLRLLPPLTMRKEHVSECLSKLEQILKEIAR